MPDYVRCRLWRKLSYALDDRGENRSRRKSRRRLYLWPGSVLDRLRRIGLELADKFEWGEDEAIWFVLTGEAPQIRPLRAGSTFRGQRTIHGAADGDYELRTIRIHAAPWVPAEEVARAYRQVQQDLLQGRNRRMGSSKTGPRVLEVYRFVREQERLNGARPSYPKLLALWNSQYPSKRFRGEYPENLRTYFDRGVRAIEAPEYKSPWKDR